MSAAALRAPSAARALVGVYIRARALKNRRREPDARASAPFLFLTIEASARPCDSFALKLVVREPTWSEPFQDHLIENPCLTLT